KRPDEGLRPRQRQEHTARNRDSSTQWNRGRMNFARVRLIHEAPTGRQSAHKRRREHRDDQSRDGAGGDQDQHSTPPFPSLQAEVVRLRRGHHDRILTNSATACPSPLADATPFAELRAFGVTTPRKAGILSERIVSAYIRWIGSLR